MPNGRIGRLDFTTTSDNSTNNERSRLLEDSQPIDSPDAESTRRSGYFFENVAQGIQDRDRERLRREIVRTISFVWAIISCLCAGSITAFSLYGPLLQSRLHYSQYRVNVISIVAEVALYLPVPFLGFLCDRYGPRPMALFSGLLFGLGYFVAAFTYRSGPPPDTLAGEGWPFGAMVVSFIPIGTGTCGLYLAGVTTCAKNYGRGKHKGFALSAPIAAFGLSGLWQSQLGTYLLSERNPDGSRGDLDVFRYFLFLAGLLLGVGIIGSFLFRIVDESELIDEAVDELERSGLLAADELYHPGGYGTLGNENARRPSVESLEERKRQEEEEARKKAWLLWAETKRFLADHTMWWLAAGFFLVTGPGEAFINNLGTIIGTLYPPPHHNYDSTTATLSGRSPLPITSPATHVSIIAIASTFGRLASGTLSDLLSPSSSPQQHRRGTSSSLTSSLRSLDPLATSSNLPPAARRISLSRIPLLLLASIFSSIGFVLLASGAVQNHAAERFWLVTALVGIGYGATFSLVPIVISCVWGVENFGTNWGIVAVVPAFSTALWSLLYASAYEKGCERSIDPGHGLEVDGRCFGTHCYQVTFWAEAIAVWVACLLWLMAWRGPGGWRSRGIVV